MALETEIKFVDEDLAALRARLVEAGARRLGGHFERNRVFDTRNRDLFAKDTLLRLRQTSESPESQGKVALMTLKRPPSADDKQSGFKVWNESECEVSDAGALAEAFFALGCKVALVYEKLREEWRLGDCTVCLDRLPFADVVEIEGEPGAIKACASLLGLDMARGTDKSYHALNREYRQERGLPEDESFAFGPGSPPAPWWVVDE